MEFQQQAKIANSQNMQHIHIIPRNGRISRENSQIESQRMNIINEDNTE